MTTPGRRGILSCSRCHKRKIKCDRLLPICGSCTKSGSVCTGINKKHGVGTEAPRSVVEYLENEIALLEREFEQDQQVHHDEPGQVERPQYTRPPVSDIASSSLDQAPGARSQNVVTPPPLSPQNSSFDYHYLVPTKTGPVSRFFGSSSVFTLTVEVLANAYRDSTAVPSSEQFFVGAISEAKVGDPPQANHYSDAVFRPETVSSMIQLYMSGYNSIYPIVSETGAASDMNAYLSSPSPSGLAVGGVDDENRAHPVFRVLMMSAIGCMIKSRYDASLLANSNAYYSEALKFVEQVTSEASPESLQAVLLLIVFCLFKSVTSGHWKLLDYACRLCVQLGYHAEQLPETDKEDDGQQKSLRISTFWSLYANERIVGQIFGRPSDLPEQIITIPYPEVLDAGVPLDTASLHAFSSAHTYRIVYIRSEIYREMYLPTVFPAKDLSWFYDRFVSAQNWFWQVAALSDPADAGIITSKVGYHSTILFLFQPLLLQALSATREAVLDPSAPKTIPTNNYVSACELIQLYDIVLSSPFESPLGLYPMTISAAHYIYISSMTIMAHCLLSLDGRVKSLAPFSEDSPDHVERPIDYRGIFTISNSCVSLLTWCADRWPGIGGMLSTYKKLSEMILPRLVKEGLT